jgi:Serine dehydrogenase proteinase
VGSWGKILKEVQASAEQRAPLGLGPDLDGVRLKYINRIRERGKNERAVIVYASGWLRGNKPDVDASVGPSDVHALMEVCHEVEERKLDLVLHSPGGSGQAAEQMLNYLRTQFDEIRAFVPLQAKSAATMIALGCDEIVMGRHSELGPIDPQLLIPVPEGQRFAPAHAILRDFQRAQREIAENVQALPAWTPILRTYAGGLVEYCYQQIQLSQEVVAGWLAQYMLAHDDAGIPAADREQRALDIAKYFGSDEAYDRFRTHGRPMRIEELQELEGLRITPLEKDDDLQDAVLSLYHALDITFGGPTVKVVENHLGARYVRTSQMFAIPVPMAQPVPGAPLPQAPGIPQPPALPRAERRRQDRAAKKGG